MVTAQWINSDWEMESFVLEAKSMDESHTAVHIAERLREMAATFSIPAEKIVAIVHNNVANMTLKQEASWGQGDGRALHWRHASALHYSST